MRFITCIVLIFLSTVPLLAQETDSVTYTVSPDEESQTQDDAVTQEENTETESVSHTLVEPEALQKTVAYKSEKVAVRKFDRKKWKEIIGTTTYTSKKKPKKEEKEKEKNDITVPNIPWAGDGVKVVFYGLIFAIFALIIYFVVKNASSLDYKLRKNKLQIEDITKPIENIEALDVLSLLQQTLADGNFKLAVRLYYLGLLKKLNEAEIIVWKKDKTNHDYLTEIFSRDFFYDEIKALTRAYEEVWYGDHGINRETFEKLSVNFENVQQRITIPQSA